LLVGAPSNGAVSLAGFETFSMTLIRSATDG
jgi:hypothetical protein